MMSQTKKYNKPSMQFLQELLKELTKTKSFKLLVDKSAKDKIREE